MPDSPGGEEASAEQPSEEQPSEKQPQDEEDATFGLPAAVASLRADDATAGARTAADAAVDLVGADAAAIHTVASADGDEVFRPLATHAETLYGGPYRETGDGVVGRAHRSGETQHVGDLRDDPAAAPSVGAAAAMAVPTDAGVFLVLAEGADAFGARDRVAIETLATAAAAEIGRARALTSLDEEQDRFAALFDNVPDAAVGYVVEDDRPIVESVNAAFVRVFGHAAEAAIGESLVDLVVPDDAGERLPEREGGGDDHEVERATADGRRSFLVRRVPVGSEPQRGFCIYTDVSELKRRERELRAQNRRLETFASVVSHDLRNPMSVARGYAEMLEPSEPREKVVDGLDRMQRIVDDVLALALDHDDLDREPTDLERLARQAWATVETGDATLAVETSPTLSVDSDRVIRLLENLFRNAVEHGSTSPRSQAHEDAVEHGSTSPRSSSTRQDAVEHGSTSNQTASDDAVEHGSPSSRPSDDAADHDGPDPTVTVGGLDGGGFYVADDGPGIPPEDRERVFEEGYSASSSTGLGLAIVREIATAHGWTVRATESADGGAQFEFRPECQD
jgi:PAS domain S-box-containing protein